MFLYITLHVNPQVISSGTMESKDNLSYGEASSPPEAFPCKESKERETVVCSSIEDVEKTIDQHADSTVTQYCHYGKGGNYGKGWYLN